MTVARRVMDGIAKLDAVDDYTISVSAAVARFPQDGADAEALLEAARDGAHRDDGAGLDRRGDGGLGSGPGASGRRAGGYGSSAAARQASRPATRRTASTAPASTAAGSPVASTIAYRPGSAAANPRNAARTRS